MPGCLGLDANIGNWWGFYGLVGRRRQRPRALGEVKFTGEVLPTAGKSPIAFISNVS